MTFLLVKLNWRLTVHDSYFPFSYHNSPLWIRPPYPVSAVPFPCTVLKSFSLACSHLLHSCVVNGSLITSSFSRSIQNLLLIISFCIFFILILIPAITSLWSDAVSGPVNVQHFVTALFHLLLTMMKSIMLFPVTPMSIFFSFFAFL